MFQIRMRKFPNSWTNRCLNKMWDISKREESLLCPNMGSKGWPASTRSTSMSLRTSLKKAQMSIKRRKETKPLPLIKTLWSLLTLLTEWTRIVCSKWILTRSSRTKVFSVLGLRTKGSPQLKLQTIQKSSRLLISISTLLRLKAHPPQLPNLMVNRLWSPVSSRNQRCQLASMKIISIWPKLQCNHSKTSMSQICLWKRDPKERLWDFWETRRKEIRLWTKYKLSLRKGSFWINLTKNVSQFKIHNNFN